MAHGGPALRGVGHRSFHPVGNGFRLGPLSVLDWTCLLVIAGCGQTIALRLHRIMTALRLEVLRSLMLPQTALHDPIFLALRPDCPDDHRREWGNSRSPAVRLQEQIASIWQTYRGWLVMAPLALGIIFSGRAPLIIGVTLLAIFGFKEFARLRGSS